MVVMSESSAINNNVTSGCTAHSRERESIQPDSGEFYRFISYLFRYIERNISRSRTTT